MITKQKLTRIILLWDIWPQTVESLKFAINGGAQGATHMRIGVFTAAAVAADLVVQRCSVVAADHPKFRALYLRQYNHYRLHQYTNLSQISSSFYLFWQNLKIFNILGGTGQKVPVVKLDIGTLLSSHNCLDVTCFCCNKLILTHKT